MTASTAVPAQLVRHCKGAGLSVTPGACFRRLSSGRCSRHHHSESWHSGYSDRFGQAFVIENRPGAATNVSIQAALTSPARWLPRWSTLERRFDDQCNSVSKQRCQLPAGWRKPLVGLVIFPRHRGLTFTSANNVAELIAFARSIRARISMAFLCNGDDFASGRRSYSNRWRTSISFM